MALLLLKDEVHAGDTLHLDYDPKQKEPGLWPGSGGEFCFVTRHAGFSSSMDVGGEIGSLWDSR